jgi:hypothetical protein
MKYAWIENDKIRDVAHGNPSEIFHADVAKFYDTQVPDEAVNGQGWDGINLIPIPVPVIVIPEPQPVVPPKVSAIEYKMLFTVQERIAIKTSTDVIIQDLYELLNDQRVATIDLSLKSISDALDYMTALNILVVGRKAEILLGKVS